MLVLIPAEDKPSSDHRPRHHKIPTSHLDIYSIMPKRKLVSADEPEPTPRRSGRLQKSEDATALGNVSVKAQVKDKQVKPALYWFASGLFHSPHELGVGLSKV